MKRNRTMRGEVTNGSFPEEIKDLAFIHESAIQEPRILIVCRVAALAS